MSALVSCPACDVELEVPPNFNESVVDCPSCSTEFELDVEDNPYQAPDSRVGRGGIDNSKTPPFPAVCTTMATIIIILELIRIGIAALIVVAISDIQNSILVDQSKVQVLYVFLGIMVILNIFGITSSIMMMKKNKSAGTVAKVYAGFVLVGLAYSFVSFNILSVLVNGVIALLLVISIINYNSWIRQNKELEKLDRRRSRGQQRKRPSGRLKKRKV